MPASAVFVKKRGGVLSKPAAAHFWGSVGVNNDGQARERTTGAKPQPVLALCMQREARIPLGLRPWRNQFAHSRSPGWRQPPPSRPKAPHSRRHCRRAQPASLPSSASGRPWEAHKMITGFYSQNGRWPDPNAHDKRGRFYLPGTAGLAKGKHAQGRDLLPGLAFELLKAQVVDEGSRSH